MNFLTRLVGTAAALLVLLGCSADVAPAATVPAPAVAQNSATPTTRPTNTATAVPPTVTAAPTATATLPPTPTTVATSSCLDCHSSQEMLINTAAPVVEAGEGESSGVG